MKNRPTYAIDSVDHALRLIVVLQQEGPLRVADAAQRLGVARSTAHRLLTMLVYRDFAEQHDDHRYGPGPALSARSGPEPVAELRRLALPHLQALSARTDETANLMVLAADQIRFLATIECSQVLRVGDREGRMLPAHLASGGRAILATWPKDKIVELYARHDPPPVDVPTLLRDLKRISRQGFAVNDQQTETGVTAIGCALTVPYSTSPAALSLAIPTARYRRDQLLDWAQTVQDTARAIERDLHTHAVETSHHGDSAR